MRSLRRWLLLGLVLVTSTAANASLTTLSSLFVFGDSLSDGGNSGLLTQNAVGVTFPPPPYAPGQYSNGPVAVQYLWNVYNPGAPGAFTPSLAGGTNYALGGATSGTANFNTVSPNVPAPLQPAFANMGAASQLQQFMAAAPTFDPATSLFVVWLMPNDVFYAPTGLGAGTVPGSPGGANVVSNGIANIATIVQTLAAAGAQHFLVPNMPDLALTPAFRGTAQAAGLSALTGAFNAGLASVLTDLDDALPIEIVQFDTYAAINRLVADPGAFGFTNVTDSCVANLANGLCNPATWLFWDEVHPTTSAHRLLGLQFAQAVPEPGALPLLALALLFLAAGRCRRAPVRGYGAR